MDGQDELVTIAWIAKRMGIARPSVTKIMRAMGGAALRIHIQMRALSEVRGGGAIAASYRPASAGNE